MTTDNTRTGPTRLVGTHSGRNKKERIKQEFSG